MTNLVGLMFLANLSQTYMRNETNACKRKKNNTHTPYKKRARGKCPNWKRAVAIIKIQKGIKYKKRKKLKPTFISHTVNRLLPKIQNVESGNKNGCFPRSQTTGYSDMRVSIRWDWVGYNPNLFRLWNIINLSE